MPYRVTNLGQGPIVVPDLSIVLLAGEAQAVPRLTVGLRQLRMAGRVLVEQVMTAPALPVPAPIPTAPAPEPVREAEQPIAVQDTSRMAVRDAAEWVAAQTNPDDIRAAAGRDSRVTVQRAMAQRIEALNADH